MDNTLIPQIIEAIKTLNININDATTQKIADTILPVFKWYYLMNFINNVMVFLGLLSLFIAIYKLIKYAVDRNPNKCANCGKDPSRLE